MRGREYESLEQAKSENLATARKLVSALEQMRLTGEVYAFDFWRTLLFDTANANIRYMEAMQREIDNLKSSIRSD